jgi:hypothetical protein
VQVGTRQYLVDAEKVQRRTIPAQRQAITQNPAGLDAVNIEGAWTKVLPSFHHGAGQSVYDGTFSNPYRSNMLAGLHCEEGLITLDQIIATSSADTNVTIATCNIVADNAHLYARSGTTLKRWTVSLGATATVTGITSPVWLAISGGFLYATDGSDIFRATLPVASFGAAWSTQNASIIGACNGRLLAGDGASVYELSSSGVASLIWTHPEGGTWTALVGAPGAVYGAHLSPQGDATVYVWDDVDADGTLAAPFIACVIPRREQVNEMIVVSGNIVALATAAGVRLTLVNGDGTLTLGPAVSASVYYQGGSGGAVLAPCTGLATLGTTLYGSGTAFGSTVKLHLDQFVTELVPAWSGFFGSGGRVAVTTGALLIAATGVGVYSYPHYDRPAMANVAYLTGSLITGEITFGVSDLKQPLSVEVIHDPLPAGTSVFLTLYGPSFQVLGSTTNTTDDSVVTTLTIAPTVAAQRSFTIYLAFSTTDPTKTPRVRGGIKFRAAPILPRQEEIVFPLNLSSTVRGRDGSPLSQSPVTEHDYLNGLINAGAPVQITEGSKSYYALIDQLVKPGDEDGAKWSDDNGWYEGEFLLRVITLGLT